MVRDVQSERPENSFPLTKVGVRGVLKPVQVSRPGRTVTLPTSFDVYVDIPATQRGSHLSRHLQVIEEVVDASVRTPVAGPGDPAGARAGGVLGRPQTAPHPAGVGGG